jgi:hypothetical protein
MYKTTASYASNQDNVGGFQLIGPSVPEGVHFNDQIGVLQDVSSFHDTAQHSHKRFTTIWMITQHFYYPYHTRLESYYLKCRVVLYEPCVNLGCKEFRTKFASTSTSHALVLVFFILTPDSLSTMINWLMLNSLLPFSFSLIPRQQFRHSSRFHRHDTKRLRQYLYL